jgi:hypothetical protein
MTITNPFIESNLQSVVEFSLQFIDMFSSPLEDIFCILIATSGGLKGYISGCRRHQPLRWCLYAFGLNAYLYRDNMDELKCVEAYPHKLVAASMRIPLTCCFSYVS